MPATEFRKKNVLFLFETSGVLTRRNSRREAAVQNETAETEHLETRPFRSVGSSETYVPFTFRFFERRPERTNRATGGSFEMIGAWRGAAKTAETRGGSAFWAAWQLTADGPRAAAAGMASPGNGQATPRRRARRRASGRQRPGDPAPGAVARLWRFSPP